MELTVGFLKKVIAELDDDVVLAQLKFNDDFDGVVSVKRLLLLEAIDDNWGKGKKFLTINEMGSHFTEKTASKNGLKYDYKYWDEDSFKSKA